MKTAREMFEELGYEEMTREETKDKYLCFNQNKYCGNWIEFFLEYKEFHMWVDEDYESVKLSMQELQAINQMCRELGWNVDKETPLKIKEEWVGGEDDDYVKYLCPKCHIDLYMNEHYCDNCGQKLDWSDV